MPIIHRIARVSAATRRVSRRDTPAEVYHLPAPVYPPPAQQFTFITAASLTAIGFDPQIVAEADVYADITAHIQGLPPEERIPKLETIRRLIGA